MSSPRGRVGHRVGILTFSKKNYQNPHPRAKNNCQNSPLWKRVIAWERSRAASGYGIIWGDADRNKQEQFSAECLSIDWF